MGANRFLVVAAVIASCISSAWGDPRQDAEGFYAFDGNLKDLPASDCFIVRFEHPGEFVTNAPGWLRGQRKWNFVEVRQLKDSVTLIADGRMTQNSNRQSGANWFKWVKRGARKVRVKFVTSDYTVSDANAVPTPKGFTPLFNGRDLTGWKGVTREGGFNVPEVRRAALPEKRKALQSKADALMREHWFVRDGALFFDGLPGGYSIATEKDYRNFELIVDWRLLRVYGDSGLYLRGMPQVQIWDPEMWSGIGSGGIYNNYQSIAAATTCQDNPIGSWNRFRIRLVGNRVWVWLNGVKVTDGVTYENKRNKKAGIPLVDQIELQCHGDPIEFRGIFIRELPEDPKDVPNPKAAVRGDPIDLLKDGLSDWKPFDETARMGWSVKNGILSNYVTDDPAKNSRGGSGGTHLVTKREDFFDFDLSYDVRVPQKCNSGVYLRGRYEIQVKDSYGRKPDCHNMAALYDLITPTAAAEKPAGEWQHVDLTLYRRHLTVILNGTKIIDNRPIPGVTPGALDANELVPGPILLQGDHSNASFRNMILTPILR